MPSILDTLEHAFRSAIHAAFGLDADPLITPSANPQFGDYQSNAAMGLTKRVAEQTGAKANPRQVAEQIKAKLELGKIATDVSIAGPGFINVRLSPAWLAEQLNLAAADDHLGVPPAASPQTIVADYSAPNVAKEMHVGHLRSTIIGDCFARTLSFLGHTVIRQNHIGDWGTQFGRVMLGLWYEAAARSDGTTGRLERWMAEIRQLAKPSAAATSEERGKRAAQWRTLVGEIARWHVERYLADPAGTGFFVDYLNDHFPSVARLQSLYQFASAVTESEVAAEFDIPPDANLATLASRLATFVQRPDVETNRQEAIAWRKSRDATMAASQLVYEQLGVLLTPDDVRGESDYRDDLKPIVAEMTAAIAVASEGATVIFDERFDAPLIVQKSDGGFGYATTDLAAIAYRVRQLHADRIIYVVGLPQSQHFAQVFGAARRAQLAGDSVALEHAGFGNVLGDDGKILRTRAGGTVKLSALLDEAEERALALVNEKGGELPDAQKRAIARAVGIGAVKYFDLLRDRIGDYKFSFDAMLAMDGNTAPYLQYAHARIRSIFRKSNDGVPASAGLHVAALVDPQELTLAKTLLRFSTSVETVARELKPHVLCTYLYELAGAFSSFYEACPVLKSDEPTRSSRLALCDLTARTIACGLDLLGIEHPEQM